MYDSEEEFVGKPSEMYDNTTSQQNNVQYEFKDSGQGLRQTYGGINLKKSSDQMFGDTSLQRCRTQMYEKANPLHDDREYAANTSKQMFGDTKLLHCPTEMYELGHSAQEPIQMFENGNLQQSYDQMFSHDSKHARQEYTEAYNDTDVENDDVPRFGEECFDWDMSYEEGKLGLQIANSTEELYSQFTDFAKGFDKFDKLQSLCQEINSISLFHSDYWLRQAGVLDDDFITCQDTSWLFWDKFGDVEIDFRQWMEYVEELCFWKQLDHRTVKMLLISCGHLGEKPVVMPKSLPEYYRPYVDLYTNVGGPQESYYWCRDVHTSTSAGTINQMDDKVCEATIDSNENTYITC